MRRFARSLAALGLCSCFSTPAVPRDAVLIGAMLPFSGVVDGTGENLEHAMVLATDAINAAGGIGTKPVAVYSIDTHSTLQRGLSGAADLLQQQHVKIVVGPEEPDTATAMTQMIVSAGAVQLLPGLASPKIADTTDSVSRWFRLAPPPEIVGCTLGLRLLTDNVKRLAIYYSSDSYNASMESGLMQTLSTQPSLTVEAFSLDAALDVGSLSSFAPDGIVFFAPPDVVASVVQDVQGVVDDTTVHWYLPPQTNNGGFLQSGVADLLKKSTGLSPAILQSKQTAFSAAFSARWGGDVPLPGAYFYYDAVALASLALARADAAGDTSDASLAADVQAVSLSGGQSIQWNELGKGIAAIKSGQAVNYSGLTGEIDFDAQGELTVPPELEFWSIAKDQIVFSGQVSLCVSVDRHR